MDWSTHDHVPKARPAPQLDLYRTAAGMEVRCDYGGDHLIRPTEHNGPPSGTTGISFYCDDIEATVADLKKKGVELTQGIEDHGYGLVTYFNVPGSFTIQLYQLRYSK